MVVDDDPDILITIRRIFEKEGYEVFTVDSGIDCIKELERGFKEFLQESRKNAWQNQTGQIS